MLRFAVAVFLLLTVGCVHVSSPIRLVRVVKITDDGILVAYDAPTFKSDMTTVELEMTELAEYHCPDSYDFGKQKTVTATRTRQVENTRIPRQECSTYTSYSGPMGSRSTSTQCRTVWPNPSYSTQVYSVAEHRQWIVCDGDDV